MKLSRMNLQMFGSDKDFFSEAFNEAYNITEPTPETPEVPESVSDDSIDETPVEDNVTTLEKNVEPETKPLSKEEIKQMYEEYYGEPTGTPELDEETQSALELYKYLESNPHLVQAMRDVDSSGYQELNRYVPDEITRQLEELKNFKQEMEYNQYVSELKSKYEDFNEDAVLEYAEKNDVLNLEVAYKAMKSENAKQPDVEALREQIKKELLEELKQNSINTQSLVGGISQKPINNGDNVSLSSREQRIAKAMGMTPSEYAKWS